jgi:hypothetical protein
MTIGLPKRLARIERASLSTAAHPSSHALRSTAKGRTSRVLTTAASFTSIPTKRSPSLSTASAAKARTEGRGSS